jgi:hypothetical protein
MSYKVIKTEDGYDLLEKNSNVTIEIGITDEIAARSVCRKLNLGSGFNGWTPAFLAIRLTKNDK